MLIKILLGVLIVFQTSLYSLHFTTASGNNVSLSAYQGKKILFVNIATGSRYVSQLSALQLLQERYGDSLAVLAFPSNSFSHEPREDSAILSFCTSVYHTNFPVARKSPVNGTGTQPVYNWLGKGSENGAFDSPLSGDFQKYLISSSGEIIGVYAPNVNPMDSVITKAVMDN